MKYLLLLFPFFVNAQTTVRTAPPYAVGTKSDTVPFGGAIAIGIDTTQWLHLVGLVGGAKDFDYTIYTSHWLTTIDNTDSLHELYWLRKIQKKADELKIISITNTADCITYKLHFIGWQSDTHQFLYTDDKQEMIWIDPCTPMVIIGRTKYY